MNEALVKQAFAARGVTPKSGLYAPELLRQWADETGKPDASAVKGLAHLGFTFPNGVGSWRSWPVGYYITAQAWGRMMPMALRGPLVLAEAIDIASKLAAQGFSIGLHQRGNWPYKGRSEPGLRQVREWRYDWTSDYHAWIMQGATDA